MRTPDEHLAAIRQAVAPRPTVTVPLADAASRVLAVHVTATHPSPRFDNSQMDGYALSAAQAAATPGSFPVGPTLPAGTDPADYYAMTAELDASLDEAAANPYLVSTLRTLRLHLARLRRLAADDPARLATSAAEHADIADAVGSGAADLAEATTRVHLHHAFHHLTRRTRADETPTLLSPTEGDRP